MILASGNKVYERKKRKSVQVEDGESKKDLHREGFIKP